MTLNKENGGKYKYKNENLEQGTRKNPTYSIHNRRREIVLPRQPKIDKIRKANILVMIKGPEHLYQWILEPQL